MGASEKETAHTKYWLQKWIAVGESIGIGKKNLLNDYYFDEFLAVIDAYNDMHTINRENEKEEVYADDW